LGRIGGPLVNTPLQGKVALVTGGSRGIGRQVASALAEAGAEVLLTSRTAESGRAAADQIRANGGKARDVVLDICDDAAVKTVVTDLLKDYGTIPLLVNNAGITRDGLLLRMKKVDWDAVIETNLSGTYRLCRAMVPSMIRARYGRIVNITSVVAQAGNPGQVNYAAAKAGTEGFTRSLARELASRNVTINCVAPGLIDTHMTRTLDDASRKHLLERVPMKRLGETTDVAAAVLFLLAHADYITGATLNVNGGMYM
jgi:3-oxoacyl-[acyl-carrier protein] reductase